LKRLYSVLIGFVMALLSGTSLAQTNEVCLSRFKLKLTNGEQVEGYNAKANPDEFVGTLTDGTRLTVDRDDILALYRQEGFYAAEGFVIGGGLGCLAAVLYNSLKSDDAGAGSQRTGTTRILIGAVAGGVVGALVGSKIEAWQKVLIPLEWTFRTDPDRPYLGFSVKF